jgi:hypothetical protein
MFGDKFLKTEKQLFFFRMTCLPLIYLMVVKPTRSFIRIHSIRQGSEELWKWDGVEVEPGESAWSMTSTTARRSFKSCGLAKEINVVVLVLRMGIHPSFMWQVCLAKWDRKGGGREEGGHRQMSKTAARGCRFRWNKSRGTGGGSRSGGRG